MRGSRRAFAALLLLVSSRVAFPAAASCPALPVNASAAVFITDASYATWTIDTTSNRAFFVVDWADPALRALAAAIGGRAIRVGGSGGDVLAYGLGSAPPCAASGSQWCLNASTARALAGFAVAAATPMYFGLNIHPTGGSPPQHPWNATNARALLEFVRDEGLAPAFAGFELGNECNSNGLSAPQQSAAFAALSALLTDVFPQPLQRPQLAGPDADGASSPRLGAYLANFSRAAAAAGVPLFSFTFHEYIEVTNVTVLQPSTLDLSAAQSSAVVAAVRGSGSPLSSLPVWAGEIGPHTGDSPGDDWDPTTANCRGNMLCGRFGSLLWYADSLSAHARAGVSRFFRQDLLGAMYGLLLLAPGGALTPSPDYYFLHTWQRVVGAGVLALAAAPPPPPGVRAYAFCARARGAAAAALVLVNIGAAPACVGLHEWAAPGVPAEVWSFTSGDDAEGITAFSTRLNGAPLALRAPGVLPSMPPALIDAAGGITLPPLSATLAVVTAAQALPACAE